MNDIIYSYTPLFLRQRVVLLDHNIRCKDITTEDTTPIMIKRMRRKHKGIKSSRPIIINDGRRIHVVGGIQPSMSRSIVYSVFLSMVRVLGEPHVYSMYGSMCMIYRIDKGSNILSLPSHLEDEHLLVEIKRFISIHGNIQGVSIGDDELLQQFPIVSSFGSVTLWKHTLRHYGSDKVEVLILPIEHVRWDMDRLTTSTSVPYEIQMDILDLHTYNNH